MAFILAGAGFEHFNTYQIYWNTKEKLDKFTYLTNRYLTLFLKSDMGYLFCLNANNIMKLACTHFINSKIPYRWMFNRTRAEFYHFIFEASGFKCEDVSRSHTFNFKV